MFIRVICGKIPGSMPKVAAIVGFCLVALLVFNGGVVSAQTRKGPPRAARFDQFGQVGHCDVTARLDNFAIQLENQPGAKGVIVSYAPEGDGPGTGKNVLEMVKGYIVNTRGLAEDRIETIYGGRNSDKYQSQTELWIVPKGASLPKPKKLASNNEPFQGLFHERAVHDDFGVEYEDEMGPGIGNSTYASFAEMLHQQKSAIAYVVIYSGEELTPGAWRRLGQEDINRFKAFNLELNRFKLIFGGEQKEARIQYWIWPDNAPQPVADAGSEKALAKTVKAGDFYSFALQEENNQKAIFSRLSEILTVDKTVRAFLVVRLEEPEPELDPEEAAEPVDLTKLVDKWRIDLANTHKIGPDRFIIVFTSESSQTGMTLWIVPKGAPLPNPREDDTEREP